VIEVIKHWRAISKASFHELQLSDNLGPEDLASVCLVILYTCLESLLSSQIIQN